MVTTRRVAGKKALGGAVDGVLESGKGSAGDGEFPIERGCERLGGDGTGESLGDRAEDLAGDDCGVGVRFGGVWPFGRVEVCNKGSEIWESEFSDGDWMRNG